MSDICWICNDVCDERNNFCGCNEEYKVVHIKCMQLWINYSKKKECNLCKTKYNIKKTYVSFKKWNWCFNDKKTTLFKIFFILFALVFIFLTITLSNDMANLVTGINDLICSIIFLIVYTVVMLTSICFSVFVVAIVVDFLLEAKEKNSFLTIREIV
ncbi:5L protein [Yaba-like disease virus]|uniref:E3 ubiquitin-protein ligase LAP n=1 Tax=Yaba-like disease virus TaxID=132475 RepID=LAP_YLDV|nr:5L protein [Yaba-like disease virus]Q9DHV7.1 RecName: Full=E3 ubiquitin-protein ligase LAP; AltName: Full=Leukemia associated protein; Short=LAP; AltName: Full=RING-type E3 ubiquitin transferase LAP [Yaba-like disease virus]CAC21243.1 5L protein [Yaba-like disease virus]